jgi:hypothetical protein
LNPIVETAVLSNPEAEPLSFTSSLSLISFFPPHPQRSIISSFSHDPYFSHREAVIAISMLLFKVSA